jgi:hypothetical protein
MDPLFSRKCLSTPRPSVPLAHAEHRRRGQGGLTRTTRTLAFLATALLLSLVLCAVCGTNNDEGPSDGSALDDGSPRPNGEGGATETGPACAPKTCSEQGIGCGLAGDGCGGALQCGGCTAPETCGEGGAASVCGGGCVPKTCAELGYTCGPAGDGCGGALSCGTCTAPLTCGGGGQASVCGQNDGGGPCVPKTCAGLGYDCGPAGDGCGGALSCGTCTAPETCGGGGKTSLCGGGCAPKTCTGLGYNCGPAGDGCWGSLSCGTCMAPETCGGGGASSVCGPTSTGDSGTTPPAGDGGESGMKFDYFISPTGDDNNAGTLASPWSITALNSKQTIYSGKHVGIIGDVKGAQIPFRYGAVGGARTTLYSMVQSQKNGAGLVLAINGGNSSASTYVASCNSAGAYSPRLAIIDFSNPAGGAKPTVETYAMGQSFYGASVPNPGYTTIDGLTIRNFTFSGLGFSDLSGTINGVVIQNCEIYNGGNVVSNDNPGAIVLAGCVGPVVTNNKIHDLQTIPGGADPQWGLSALRTYNSTGIVCTHNTFYNCSSVLTKDSHQWFADCSYNYMDHGIFGSAGPGGDLSAGAIVGQCPGAGQISVVHHNIMLGNLGMHPQDGTPVTGTMKFYNNTIYGSSAYTADQFQSVYCDTAGTGAVLQFYNNVVYAMNGYDDSVGSMYVNSGYAIAGATFHNNVYGSNGNVVTFSRTEYSPLSLAPWKSSTGCDANSVLVSSSPFTGTPTPQVPSSFAVGSSATIGGVTSGALDGSGNVGCDF